MQITSFGLDIGTRKIRAVQLGVDGKKIFLKSCASVPMPKPGITSYSSFDLETVSATIHKLVHDTGIATKYVNVALPDNVVYTKVVEIPQMSEKDVTNAITWEAEQSIPAPLPTITLSWQTLRKRVKGIDNMLDVLLVGAPTSLIKKYQSVLEMAELRPESMETELLAVIRSLNLASSSPPTLIMHVSELSTSIAIVEGGILTFVYAVPIGYTAFLRTVTTEFGFAEDQAEQYMKAYGITGDQVGAKIAKALDPLLQNMIGEIKKALAFYTDKYGSQTPVHQLLLSGSITEIAGLDLYFVQSMDMETVVANPWKMHSITNVPQQLIETNNEYAVGVGLGLKEYAK